MTDLLPRLKTIKREFRRIALAWQAEGAEGVVLTSGDRVILSIPADLCIDHTSHSATLNIDGNAFNLHVVGESVSVPRVETDAYLLQKLLQREGELEALSDEFVNTQDQLLAFYNLTHSLRDQVELKDILRTLATEARHLTGAEHTFLIYVEDDTPPAVGLSGAGRMGLENYLDLHLQHDNAREYTFVEGDTGLLVPVRVHEARAATLGLLRKSGGFTMPDIKIADAIATQTGAYIENALLHQRQLQQTRIQTEMSLARRVQTSLLPPSPQTTDDMDVWGYSEPAFEVGGDFYDFDCDEDKGELDFVLGDVAGKGISAALLMAMTRTALRVMQNAPAQRLAQVNETLYDDLTNVDAFVTLFVARYNRNTHKLTYANAGHSPVIYCPIDGAARILEPDSPPVGVLPVSMAENHTMMLKRGDVLVIASDGLPEATSTDGKMLGYDHLMQLIELYRNRPAETLGRMLLRAAHSMNEIPGDDRTVIVLKRIE